MGAFGTESLVDELARELDIDPIDLRLKNASEEGDRNTLGLPFARIGFKETLEEARKHPHYKGAPRRLSWPASANRYGRLTPIATSSCSPTS